MASVTSLGLHQPTGLQYAIQEQLLTPDTSTSSYTWLNYVEGDANKSQSEDELLVTKRCVIWSRGGVFRKSYNFELEKEDVSHALLTSFPSVGALNSKESKNFKDGPEDKKDKDSRGTAIVVFLKTQAHIYFLSGTSHVIHLPFEVESVSESPSGLVIQRKLRVDNLVPAALKFPRVPPNSFVSSQPQPWSAASSQTSTFSTANLGAPNQLYLGPSSTLKDLWEPPSLTNDSKWPRLFSLSDPLAEMGLVVTQNQKSEPSSTRKRGSMKFTALSTAEEIIHISRRDEFPHKDGDHGLILALTLNRETSMYTIWKLSYASPKPEAQRAPSGRMSRRRSSFVIGSGTGVTTPVNPGQASFLESFGGNLPIVKGKKGPRPDISIKEVINGLGSPLDAEFDAGSLPRRSSRRVSSMLARADLSASHERSTFSELAHGTSRRGESLGGGHIRTSAGGYTNLGAQSFPQPSQFNNSIGSVLEAPVDDLLDELRAGGDFEGFHNMGLDDEEFEALKQEIFLTKISSVPVEHSNVRYSTQGVPAKSQCRVFTLTAPLSAADDKQGNTIVLCVLDSDEKKLLVMTIYAKSHKKARLDRIDDVEETKSDINATVITLGTVTRASGVIDACRLDDGQVSRILVLTEAPDGHSELSLQAPWSVLMKVRLPEKFTSSNIRNLGHDSTPKAKRDGSFKRVLSHGPRGIRGLRNVKPRGVVDLLDDEGRLHQIQLTLEPRNPHVRKILEICRMILPGSREGEGVLAGWWNAMQWFQLESIEVVDIEWSALVVTLFALVLVLEHPSKVTSNHKQRKSRSGFLRSSSGAHSDLESWSVMQSHEASNGNSLPSWAENKGWSWLSEEGDMISGGKDSDNSQQSIFQSGSDENVSFTKKHVNLTLDFMKGALGSETILTVLPTRGEVSAQTRKAALVDILMALHLLREEQKLDITTADALSAGTVTLAPVLSQIFRWLRWDRWTEFYDLEESSLLNVKYDAEFCLRSPPLEPTEIPSIYNWIQTCLMTRKLAHILTLPELVATRSIASSRNASSKESWLRLTPRTLVFRKFFALTRKDWSAVQFVETLAFAGVDTHLLGTLPEAVLVPLQEAIIQCQVSPPTKWSKHLLELVGREDVNFLLSPGLQPGHHHPSLLVCPPLVAEILGLISQPPSHDSSFDVHTVCLATTKVESTGSFDGSAEVDRQAITRSIWKDDRRMNEAMTILSTYLPVIARAKSEPDWTESDLLEAQKEHVQMLAYRTLAIPSGRGLLYFSARIPLLTQRFAIAGFNLSCVMKPDNNTVGVDKNAFTEEKVCWAFFHAGVAAGLSISREAKGIDTSWILFNKPIQDLSNRHAGFLLALGLNGHLKSVAKWVAFKYLTPKHTMTSIGLLLGLAASYIGTMDSLVTRLLSVHVTRMLPPHAAELNLSPLTQTAGIMGIGLLYCNTQHRRMSEVMVSEIEHIDAETEDEPLRNEGYRLAAGFALGFINLGKGSDLRGLHDMQLTERLLALAAGSKKVDIVHVLDKSTAAAVIALALIFMKSENQVLARKIDVPDSILQFDYVRPDIFLLRTVAKNLIMWSKIEPSFAWIRDSLPEPYRWNSKLDTLQRLSSSDLPFYDILAGLCFSIALKYAGSGSSVASDLLIHYLDWFMRICQLPVHTYDEKLARNTVRNCQDLVALAAATVMAGSGDLAVFRRLRSMHGRDSGDTPYGSHLAAHLAIGVLFLGGGTFTFGTSKLAVAALLVSFYPIFPSSVQDNKSHLQAFRHFWVLAAEARCLVARDFDTNQPVSIPVIITFRNHQTILKHTPCLLPELDQLKRVTIVGPEYWNIVLDLEDNPVHMSSFKSTQTIHVRRRPVQAIATSTFQATLQALDDGSSTPPQPLDWLFELPAFSSLTRAERALVLPPDHGGPIASHAGTTGTVVDTKLVLEKSTLDSGKKDRLLGLRLLFDWADRAIGEGTDMQGIKTEVIERLKAKVWMMAKNENV